jgi:outer membrane protein
LKKNVVMFSALVLGVAALACAQAQPAPVPPAAPAARPAQAAGPAPTKIAIINIQRAILSTKDGQKAAQDLQAKYNPRRSTLEKKQADITAMQDQLRKGGATMSDEAKARLQRDIDSNQKSLQREAQDLNDDADQENQKLINEIGSKMMAVIEQYASQNGFAVVLDVSNPQTPVLWAAAATDITPDIVRLYDLAHPEASAAKPAAPPDAVKK